MEFIFTHTSKSISTTISKDSALGLSLTCVHPSKKHKDADSPYPTCDISIWNSFLWKIQIKFKTAKIYLAGSFINTLTHNDDIFLPKVKLLHTLFHFKPFYCKLYAVNLFGMLLHRYPTPFLIFLAQPTTHKIKPLELKCHTLAVCYSGCFAINLVLILIAFWK